MKLFLGVALVVVMILYQSFALAQQQGQAKFVLNWKYPSTTEEGFRIYRDGNFVGTVAKGVLTYEEIVIGTWNQKVCYQVSAFNHAKADGSGAIQETLKSNEACSVIPVPDIKPPDGAPSDLTTQPISTSAIQLRWRDNASNETASLIQKRQNFPPNKRFEILLEGENTSGYTDVALRRDREYCYRVRAENSAGSSAYSNESCARTLK